jgi:hypothetical protein
MEGVLVITVKWMCLFNEAVGSSDYSESNDYVTVL